MSSPPSQIPDFSKYALPDEPTAKPRRAAPPRAPKPRAEVPAPRVVVPAPSASASSWAGDITPVNEYFRSTYGRDLPISAKGQTDYHASKGLNHSGRYDVGLDPDSDEGRGLIEHLTRSGIPHTPFRQARGIITGKHIHIGTHSPRVGEADTQIPDFSKYALPDEPEQPAAAAPTSSAEFNGAKRETRGAGDHLEHTYSLPGSEPITFSSPKGTHFDLSGGELKVKDSPGPSVPPSPTAQTADEDEVEEVIESSRGPAPARPGPPELPARRALDPRVQADRAERDARASAEASPDARKVIDVGLPAGVKDWSDASGKQLARQTVEQFAQESRIPAEFLSEWVRAHDSDLRFYNLQTGEDLSPSDEINTPRYDPERRTIRVSAELPFLKKLEADYDNWKSHGRAALDWLTDESRSAGEKFLDVAGPVASGAATVADYASRPLEAIDAGSWAQGRTNNPALAVTAAVGALKGDKTPEYARNPVGDYVRKSETLRDINPNLPGLAGGVAEMVTSPSNLIPFGVAADALKGARGVGKVLNKLDDVAEMGRTRINPKPLGIERAEVARHMGDGTLSRLAGDTERLPATADPLDALRMEVPDPLDALRAETPDPLDALRAEVPDAPTAKAPARWQHRKFGEVTEAADQNRLARGYVRVVDADGAQHIIKRADGNGAGNQIAFKLGDKAESAPEVARAAQPDALGAMPSPAPTAPANLTRNFRAGTNDASLTFASAEQRDLYDLAAKSKYQMGGGQVKASQRAVGDVDTLRSSLASRLNLPDAEVQNLAARVYEDVRGQMKGVKHLEERALTDDVLGGARTAAPDEIPDFTRHALPEGELRASATAAPSSVSEIPDFTKHALPDDAPKVNASDHFNLSKLNVGDDERASLARLIEQRIKETGATKERVTFEDVKKEAAELAPGLVKKLRKVKPDDPHVFDPAFRYAAKQRLTALNSERVELLNKIEAGRNSLTADEVTKLETRAALLEHDANQLLDVLIPTRSAMGRALAMERMMVDATGFDLETHVARARRVASRSGQDVASEGWKEKERAIRNLVAEGQDAEKILADVEAKIGQAQNAPEYKAADEALGKARAARASERDAAKAARRATADTYKVKLGQLEQQARARLSERLKSTALHDITGTGEMIADLAVIGASKLARQNIDRVVWAREMIDEFGDQVVKHLPAIYKRSFELYDTEKANAFRAAQALRLSGGDLSKFTTAEIDELIKQAGEQRARVLRARQDLARTYQKLQRTSGLDTFSALRKSSLLANVYGVGRDVFSTGIYQPTDQVARAFGSLADIAASLASKNDRQLLGAQPITFGRATLAGYKKARVEIPQVFRHGATREQLERLELPHEINRNRFADAAVKVVGRYRASIDLPAYNQARDFALRERAQLWAMGEKKKGLITDVRARASELYARPPESLQVLADADAAQLTFHETTVASEALKRAKSVGGATRAVLDTIIPFERAVSSVFYQSVQYAGLGIPEAALRATVALWRRSLTPAGQRAMSQAFGRGATGIVALMPLGYYLGSKGLITGAFDDEQGQRELNKAAGRRSLSFWNPLTGGWTSLDMLGPAMMPLAVGATIQHENSQPGQKSNADAARGVMQLATLAPQMRGVKDFSKAMSEPGSLAEYGGRYASSFIPGASSELASATDSSMREAKGFTGPIFNRVPGLRQTLPEQRDAFGRVVTGKSNESDPVTAELLRLRANLGRSKIREGESGGDFRARSAAEGGGALGALRALLNSPTYEADDYTRREMVAGVIEYAREAAREKLPAEVVEHNATVRAELIKLRVLLKRDDNLTDRQRDRVLQSAGGFLRDAKAGGRGGASVADARESLAVGLRDLYSELPYIIEEAKEPEEDDDP